MADGAQTSAKAGPPLVGKSPAALAAARASPPPVGKSPAAMAAEAGSAKPRPPPIGKSPAALAAAKAASEARQAASVGAAADPNIPTAPLTSNGRHTAGRLLVCVEHALNLSRVVRIWAAHRHGGALRLCGIAGR